MARVSQSGSYIMLYHTVVAGRTDIVSDLNERSTCCFLPLDMGKRAGIVLAIAVSLHKESKTRGLENSLVLQVELGSKIAASVKNKG